MKRSILIATLALGFARALPFALYAEDAPTTQKTEKGEENEVKVKLEECPRAVQETIKKAVGTGTIEDISKESEDGKTIYEADAKIGGKDYEIKVAEDGTLISQKLEDDEKEEGDKKDEKG